MILNQNFGVKMILILRFQIQNLHVEIIHLDNYLDLEPFNNFDILISVTRSRIMN